jgi:hypothetical protein
MIIDVKDLTDELTIVGEKIFIFKSPIKNTKNFINELNSIDSNYLINKISEDNENIEYPIGPWVEWLSNDNAGLSYGKQKTGRFNFDYNLGNLSKGHKQGIALCNQVKQCALGLSDEYFKTLEIYDVPHLPQVFDIKIYKVGALMGTHFDDHPFDGQETILSAVIYLNDDYEGGELYFDQQDIKIKPMAGCVIFFPSTKDFTHASLEITKGQKECIPLFFYKNPED